ncbi:uncharacterized protein [Drosophila kikkawai]|uniref:Uncharacterized protein n=1 Tax=Drosophila kikkawai TaxID=30033 RepID=A0ABM4GCU3_DROKI
MKASSTSRHYSRRCSTLYTLRAYTNLGDSPCCCRRSWSARRRSNSPPMPGNLATRLSLSRPWSAVYSPLHAANTIRRPGLASAGRSYSAHGPRNTETTVDPEGPRRCFFWRRPPSDIWIAVRRLSAAARLETIRRRRPSQRGRCVASEVSVVISSDPPPPAGTLDTLPRRLPPPGVWV